MRDKRGVSIIENIIAMVLFTSAFLFTIYSLSNLIVPLLGREEAVDLQLVAHNSVERIISDPGAGIVREDHIVSFDKISEFLKEEDEKAEEGKYMDLKTYLGIEDYHCKIIIASTSSRVSTYGIQEYTGGDGEPYKVMGSSVPEENDVITYADIDSDSNYEYKYNIEDFVIGEEKYTILIADSTDDEKVNYDRFYIDYDQDGDFRDEESRNFGNLTEGEGFSVEGFKYSIISIGENEVELMEAGAVDMELGEDLPYIIEDGERLYLLNAPVVVISRLVLVVSGEEYEVKRLVYMVW